MDTMHTFDAVHVLAHLVVIPPDGFKKPAVKNVDHGTKLTLRILD
jgi:hypothetical protein